MSMSHGVKEKAPKIVTPPLPLTTYVFTMFVCSPFYK